MSSIEGAADRASLEARLIGRATSDEAFRARLLAEPGAAIADELGVAVPEGLEIEVVEERPGKLYLVLPPAEAVLTDQELDAVAGGKGNGGKPEPATGGAHPDLGFY